MPAKLIYHFILEKKLIPKSKTARNNRMSGYRGSPYIGHPLLSILRADSQNGKTLKSFIIKRKTQSSDL